MCPYVISGGCASSPDRLTVRDGSDQSPSTPIVVQFCGTSNGQTVTSSAENLHIELVTDAVNQRQGFAAEFTFFTAPELTGADGLAPAGGWQIGGLTASTPFDPAIAMPTPSQPTELGDDDHNSINNNGTSQYTLTCPWRYTQTNSTLYTNKRVEIESTQLA